MAAVSAPAAKEKPGMPAAAAISKAVARRRPNSTRGAVVIVFSLEVSEKENSILLYRQSASNIRSSAGLTHALAPEPSAPSAQDSAKRVRPSSDARCGFHR